MKKFYLILLLIFTLCSSTFGYSCKRGGLCGDILDRFSGKYVAQKPARMEIDLCYYYKCKTGNWMFVEGSGTYDDFLNACNYVDPQIKKGIKEYYADYMHSDHELILAVCNRDQQEDCEKIFSDKESHKKIHENFDKVDTGPHAFSQERVDKCEHNNTPLPELSEVKCETGGICQAGYLFQFFEIEKANFTTKTCDACLLFVCTLDGKQILEGTGCYDDFVKACNKTNPSAVARFKENIKTNFYYDNSMVVASCSDADNCHKYAFDGYMNSKVSDNFYHDKNAEEFCSYEKMIEEPTIAPSAAHQKSGCNILMMLFFGIHLLLALIY